MGVCSCGQVPDPRPGQCSNSSLTLPDVTLTFAVQHPLMDEAVEALFGGPILTRTSLRWVQEMEGE